MKFNKVFVAKAGFLVGVSVVLFVRLLEAQPAFEEVAASAGIGDAGTVAAAFWYDVEGDGDLDMLETRRFWQPMVLYLNDSAHFSAQYDIGLPTEPDGQNTIPMDFDADGDLDIFACAYGSNAQLLVNTDGVYIDRTEEYGIMVSTGIRDMAWLDVNHDGWLDLLIGHYLSGWRLYRNEAGQHFTDVTAASQLPSTDFHRFCEGDINLDGNEDLFLCRISGSDRLYVNLGGGVFEDRTISAGLSAVQSRGGSEFVDFNHDKFPDLLVESLDRHTIYLNNGDGTFHEINVHGTETDFMGQPYPHAVMYAVADYDMDYDFDFYVQRQGSSPQCPNQFYRCDSLTETDAWFTDIAGEYGMEGLHDSYATWGDYDSDGDLDLFITLSGAPNELWRNNLFEGSLNNRFEVEVRGANGARDSWHSRVEVYAHGTNEVIGVSELNQGNVGCNGLNSYFVLDGNGSYDICVYFQDGTQMCAADHPNLAGIIPSEVGHRVRVTADAVSVDPPRGSHPTSFGMEAAYPNPFNMSTKIRYSLAGSSHARLTIYNLHGEAVATLVDGEISAGEHSVSWHAADLASGIYWAMLEVGAEEFAQKIVMLK